MHEYSNKTVARQGLSAREGSIHWRRRRPRRPTSEGGSRRSAARRCCCGSAALSMVGGTGRPRQGLHRCGSGRSDEFTYDW